MWGVDFVPFSSGAWPSAGIGRLGAGRGARPATVQRRGCASGASPPVAPTFLARRPHRRWVRGGSGCVYGVAVGRGLVLGDGEGALAGGLLAGSLEKGRKTGVGQCGVVFVPFSSGVGSGVRNGTPSWRGRAYFFLQRLGGMGPPTPRRPPQSLGGRPGGSHIFCKKIVFYGVVGPGSARVPGRDGGVT